MFKYAPKDLIAREGGHPAGRSKPEAGSSPVRFRKPPSDAPQQRGRPASGTKLITLRLDPAVIEKFRATGKGWQARINEALKKAVL